MWVVGTRYIKCTLFTKMKMKNLHNMYRIRPCDFSVLVLTYNDQQVALIV